MEKITEIFWNASVEELKKGYKHLANEEAYICLICGKVFEQGIIYEEKGKMYDALKFTKHHIEKEHTNTFEYLLNFDKKSSGVSDNQREMLKMFFEGYSDVEIVEKLTNITNSTVRNYRFNLREKAKQSKIFLAIMELLEEKLSDKDKIVPIHRTATQVDERYIITEDESEKVIKKYIVDGILTEFPTKEKRKLAILRYIMKKFDLEKKYSEKEVNEVIKAIYHDYVTGRRYLIEYGFMDRKKDGSEYWVKK